MRLANDEGVSKMTSELHEHDRGLIHDLNVLIGRRSALGWLTSAGVGAVAVACFGCSESSDDSASTGTTSSSSSTASGSGSGSSGTTTGADQCVADPSETNGPYPADGTNNANGSLANVLIESGIVRSDIRSSFGSLSGTADGVELTLTIKVVDVNNSCAPLEGYAVYIWHCDAAGDYSIYNLPNQNYLRGVGVTDANGEVTFTTVFPGCYSGRWPHIHFEVYPSLAKATQYSNRVLCSQFAMPENECTLVYNNVSTYSGSTSAYSRISIASDNIFNDNTTAQLNQQTPTLSGSTSSGYSGQVTVGLAI